MYLMDVTSVPDRHVSSSKTLKRKWSQPQSGGAFFLEVSI
jgi:hypothetical protein